MKLRTKLPNLNYPPRPVQSEPPVVSAFTPKQNPVAAMPMSPMHKYLGHFKKPENLAMGHNCVKGGKGK